MDTTIDLVITCMGRLDHLKQSLPQAIKQASTQCYLVDYSCPDHCSDWAQQQGYPLTTVKVSNQHVFNLSKARNAGAYSGTSPWLLFIDADIILPTDFTDKIIHQLQSKYSYHADPPQTGMMGTFLCQRTDFISIGGYDEIFQGWGSEDVDLYNRLSFIGIKKAYFSSTGVSSIVHDDARRIENYTEKEVRKSHLTNELYLMGNRHLASLTGHWPEKKLRLELFDSVIKTVNHFEDHRNDRNLINTLDNNNKLQINLGKRMIRNTIISSELHYNLEQKDQFLLKNQTINTPISRNLNLIKQRWPEMVSSSTESPLFLFSAGFRSGSTLLQRMLMKHHLMWGEPYGITGLFDQLISPFLHLNNQWPPPEYFRTHINSQNLDQHWIANLYPEPKHLMTASQQYLESLFKVPANNNGYTHWGLKEVRLNAEHASFLQWLYPEAHFLFLIRNPYNAYKSYRMFPKPWYLHQPDLLIDTVEKFANHWLNCSISFIQSSKSLNAKIIQYEHMIAPDFDWTDIENFLGFEVDKNALKNKVDGKNFHSLNPESLEHELNQLEQLVNPLASKLGYSRP